MSISHETARDLRVRVRPQRLGVVVPWNGTDAQFCQAVTMLTLVWGGRYCPIIPWGDTSEQLDLARRWLERSSPDFLYTIGVDNDRVADLANKACRPFFSREVSDDIIDDIWGLHGIDTFSVHDVVQLIQNDNPRMRQSKISAAVPDGEGDHVLLTAALSGLLRTPRECESFLQCAKAELPLPAVLDNTDAYVGYATTVDKWFPIDAGSYNLSTDGQLNDFVPCPQIVIYDGALASASLFWNMRMYYALGSGKLLLLPGQSIEDDKAVANVAQWVIRNVPRGNYFRIISFLSAAEKAKRLARRLRPRVARSGVKHIDVGCGYHGIPIVFPHEGRLRYASTMEQNRKTSIPVDAPELRKVVRHDLYWMQDLVYEAKASRTPWGLVQPPFPEIAYHVLNSPTPPVWGHSAIDPRRFSIDAVSLRVRESDPPKEFIAPRIDEFTQEYFLSHGVKQTTSEKTQRYRAFVDMLDDLQTAAASCRYPFRAFLKVMADSDAGTVNKIQGRARIDQARILGWPRFNSRDNATRKRIGDQRFDEWRTREHPRSDDRMAIFPFWTRKGVCQRVLELPKCPNCSHTHWVERIDLSAGLICPSCANAIPMPNSFNAGCRLAPLVKMAVKEGAIPVILTARLLEAASHRSFCWMPSFKDKSGNRSTFEIDLLAICDGELVFGECKDLATTDRLNNAREDVERELRNTVEKARMLEARLVVFSCLCDDLPEWLNQFVKELTTPEMKVTAFRGTELDSHQWKGTQDHIRMRNLLPEKPSPVQWQRGKGERKLGDIG